MNEEQDRKLVETFPLLYGDRHKNMRETAMCWGFETGDGWFQLIWDLSEKLEAEIKKQPEEKRHFYRASQVKEKFGTLRFYMTGETDEMRKAIAQAEELSETTCETCGKPGKTNESGWLKTTCGEHEKK